MNEKCLSLSEIREKNRTKTTLLGSTINYSGMPQELIDKERNFFEKVVQPITRKTLNNYFKK